MSFLFIVDNKKVFPNPETLLIDPFKSIWNNDKSKNKEFAISIFTYIEFMSSYKSSNPYKGYKNKKSMILKDIKLKEKDINNPLIEDAINKINEYQKEGSVNYRFYLSAINAIENLEDFLNKKDTLTLTNDKGVPIYKPKDITSALTDVKKIVENLKILEKSVNSDIEDNIKNRSDKEIGFFAKEESMKEILKNTKN